MPSSPRPWGCFLLDLIISTDSGVFPTPVGVFLLSAIPRNRSGSLPHARGGVSEISDVCDDLRSVFPTPVGVFRNSPCR